MEKKEIKVVLFDMDGVLVDSLGLWHSAMNEALVKFGKKPLTKGEFEEKYWGSEVGTSMIKLGLGKVGAEYCRSKFGNNIDKIKILPGVMEVLSSLRKKKGLVTSTPKKYVQQILDRLELKEYFDVAVTGNDVEYPKPNPEPVQKACKLLGVPPEEVALVGDTRADVQAGKSTGCKVIGLGIKADLKIDRLSELLDIFDNRD